MQNGARFVELGGARGGDVLVDEIGPDTAPTQIALDHQRTMLALVTPRNLLGAAGVGHEPRSGKLAHQSGQIVVGPGMRRQLRAQLGFGIVTSGQQPQCAIAKAGLNAQWMPKDTGHLEGEGAAQRSLGVGVTVPTGFPEDTGPLEGEGAAQRSLGVGVTISIDRGNHCGRLDAHGLANLEFDLVG